MKKQLAFISLFLLPLITFTAHADSIPFHDSTDGDMGYEADGLDLWDLNGERADVALARFKTKCDTEIPSRITARFPQIGIDPNDFTFVRRIDQYEVPGFGTSYRCYIHAVVNDQTKYRFTRWKASDQFFDIVDRKGNVIKTASEQCQEAINEMEDQTENMKLFDRHALYSWIKTRSGAPKVDMCYVTYIHLETL